MVFLVVVLPAPGGLVEGEEVVADPAAEANDITQLVVGVVLLVVLLEDLADAVHALAHPLDGVGGVVALVAAPSVL